MIEVPTVTVSLHLTSNVLERKYSTPGNSELCAMLTNLYPFKVKLLRQIVAHDFSPLYEMVYQIRQGGYTELVTRDEFLSWFEDYLRQTGF